MWLQLDYQLSNLFFVWGLKLPEFLVFFMATWLIWILAAYILFIGFKLERRQRLILYWHSLAALVLVFAINAVIAFLYWRDRPFVTFDFTPVVQLFFLDKSFPSSHSAVAWTLVGTFWLHNKKSHLLWLILGALLVSLGRVLAGVHYLSDVVIGAILGLAIAVLVAKISFKIPPIRHEQKQ